uniref:Uncharacterized protein n=1 Tax=Timema cristinae TaxID=61476 RepID=A0A7R9CE03_TIMCR|nr:unnamed protein product [Timema cristinae]
MTTPSNHCSAVVLEVCREWNEFEESLSGFHEHEKVKSRNQGLLRPAVNLPDHSSSRLVIKHRTNFSCRYLESPHVSFHNGAREITGPWFELRTITCSNFWPRIRVSDEHLFQLRSRASRLMSLVELPTGLTPTELYHQHKVLAGLAQLPLPLSSVYAIAPSVYLSALSGCGRATMMSFRRHATFWSVGLQSGFTTAMVEGPAMCITELLVKCSPEQINTSTHSRGYLNISVGTRGSRQVPTLPARALYEPAAIL